MRKGKELVSDILAKGKNSSSRIIISDRLNYIVPAATNRAWLSPIGINILSCEESRKESYSQNTNRCSQYFKSAANKSAELSAFHFPCRRASKSMRSHRFLGCIKIHQASGEWRVEMTRIPIRRRCGRARTRTRAHTHRNSITRLRIHALARGKSVWYRGDAAIEEKNVFHSYYAAYSSQSTSVDPSPRAPKSFSLLQRAECTTAGEYTRFAPAQWQPLFRYSPLDLQFRPSTHEIPAFPRNPRYFSLFDLLSAGPFPPAYLPAARRPTLPRLRVHGCLSLLLLPCARSRLSENLLPTATRPCVISTLLLAEQNERRAPILQPPHRSPTACPFLPSLPIFLIHAHHHGLSSMESNVSPVSSVYRSPGHAPFFSILRAFQSFTVFSPCCFPPPGLFG